MEEIPYITNIKECNRIRDKSYTKSLSKRNFYKQLVKDSFEIHRLRTYNDKFIEKNIIPYILDSSLVTDKVAQDLEVIYKSLRNDMEWYDRTLSFYLSQTLLDYYNKSHNTTKAIKFLYMSLYYDIVITQHDNPATPLRYNKFAKHIIEHFDEFDDEGKRTSFDYLCLHVYDESNFKDAINKFSLLYNNIIVNLPPDFLDNKKIHNSYIYSLIDTLEATCDVLFNGNYTYSPKELEMIKFVRSLLIKEYEAGSYQYREPRIKLLLLKLEFHLETHDIEDFLEKVYSTSCRFDEESSNDIDINDYIFTARMLFICYLDRFSTKSSRMKKQIIDETIKQVIEYGSRAAETSNQVFRQTALSNFVTNVAKISGLKSVKDYILKFTVMADKMLYIHSYMVNQIAVAITLLICERNITYFAGTAGLTREYLVSNKKEATCKLIQLTRDCALFHDIGKHRYIEYSKNISRTLMDIEKEALRQHTVYYDSMFKKSDDPDEMCIRDCAVLHHRWYNGKEGYPAEDFTPNKPMINIISISNYLENTTNFILHPNSKLTTLAAALRKIDATSGTRFDPYLTKLLHSQVLNRRLKRILRYERIEPLRNLYN